MEVSLTKEQKIFFICLKKLKKLEDEDPIDMNEYNKIRLFLWGNVIRFAQREINRMMGSFSTREEREEVLQELALVFLEKLPDYNPLTSAPTTFFVRYFREKISKYIRDSKIKLTQYDANNMRKINNAANFFKKRGIPYTVDMLAAQTGLSVKVVQTTILYSNNAKTASVEEAYTIQSDTPTPENLVEQQESDAILYQALMEDISADERKLVIMRINPDGRKEMPFEDIAKKTGMSIKEVKSIINKALCRLSQDDRLRHRFGNHNQYKLSLNMVSLQDKATEIMEHQLDDFLKNI